MLLAGKLASSPRPFVQDATTSTIPTHVRAPSAPGRRSRLFHVTARWRPPPRRRAAVVMRENLEGTSTAGGDKFGSDYRDRDRISRPHPRRLHGGPRARGAGDRRRRRKDGQGREGRGPVLRARPRTVAAEEHRVGAA